MMSAVKFVQTPNRGLQPQVGIDQPIRSKLDTGRCLEPVDVRGRRIDTLRDVTSFRCRVAR